MPKLAAAPLAASQPAGAAAAGILTIPARAITSSLVRSPEYISTATTQAALFIDNITTAAGSSTSCSSGCTIAYKTTAGTHTFRAEIANGTNVVLAAGSKSVTVVAGSGNNFTLTLNGAAGIAAWVASSSFTTNSILGTFSVADSSSVLITSAPAGASTAFDNAPITFTATGDQGFTGTASFTTSGVTTLSAPTAAGNNYPFTATCSATANGPFAITAAAGSSAAGITVAQLAGLAPAASYPSATVNTAALQRYSCVSGTIAVSTLYTSNNTTNNVGAYGINASTGAPTAVTGQPYAASTGPIGMVVSPNGGFIYAANTGTDTISGYSIGPTTGALSAIAGSPFTSTPVGSFPYALAITPNGSYLYATQSGKNNIHSFTVTAATGALTTLATTAASTTPHGIAITPNGTYLYVANFGTTTISGFKITAATGALTVIAGSPFSSGAGSKPDYLAVNAAGTFLYATNNGKNNVSVFSINAATGALAAIAGSPFAAGTGPAGVTFDATGSYLYVANTTSGNISAYSVNSGTGALTALAGSPYAAGTGPIGVTVTGSYLYVANQGSSSVSGFRITAGTGALTALTGSPFSSGSGVEAVVAR